MYIQILYIQLNIEDIIKTEVPLPPSKKAIINLMYTENWVREKVTSELKSFDISIQQFNVLRILNGQKGKPANLSTIQERMVSKMSNTTRLVDKLIQKNYVSRTTCPTNRRKVEIRITKEGKQFLDTVSPVINAFENNLTAHLTERDLLTLNELLNKLRTVQ